MAVLFFDSFDHYASADITKKWPANPGSPLTIATGGRWGTNKLVLGGNSADVGRWIPVSTTVVVGAAVQVTQGTPVVFGFYEGTGTKHGHLAISSGGTWGLTAVATSVAGGTQAVGVWNYFEVKYRVSNTVGGYVVKINNVEVAAGGCFAVGTPALDTQNGGTGFVNMIDLGAGANKTVWYDDLYIAGNNTGGFDDETMLGDIRVEALFPTSDASVAWSRGGSDSGSNYGQVDDATPSTADDVRSSTLDQKDRYGFGNLSTAAGTVYGVQHSLYARKSDSGTRKVAAVAELSGSESTGTDDSLSVNDLMFSELFTKPGGGDWQIDDVNNATFGLKVTG